MSAADPIRHVVLLMLENRSFDQMLGDLKSVNADINGIDRANPFTNVDPNTNAAIAQQDNAGYTLPDKVDIGHEPVNVDTQLDLVLGGTPMSGFVRDFRTHNAAGADDKLAQQVMAYFPVGDGNKADALPALHTLARNFTVCDRWFSSLPGPTWPNRLFALTGTSAGWRSMPDGLQLDGPPYVYGQETIFNRFADEGLTARSYCAGKSITWIMRQTWLHPSWRRGMDDFIEDAAGDAANFPAFAFIEPNYFGKSPDDQHPPHDVRRGEQLIADVYNAIRANQALWESTLLIIVYDEHGGFYDHVVPPKTIAPDGANQENFDFTQLGVRVPAVLVSPWLPAAVSHTLFDHTSVLRYLCDKWNLERLGLREQQANSIAQAFAGLPALRTDTPEQLKAPRVAAAVATASSVVNTNQVAIAKSIDVMHAELGFEPPSTRARAMLPQNPQVLGKRAFARAGEVEALLASEEDKHLIRVLAVHGVGHEDQDTSWQDDWRRAILAQVRAQPGAADWNVEVEFTRYDDLFAGRPLGPKEIGEAFLRLSGGLVAGPNESPKRGLLDSLGKVEDDLRWTAGMVVQWVDDEDLRAACRDRLAQHVEQFDPDLIAAHSLGSLIAYDLFRRDIAAGSDAHDQRYLITFGSQIANRAVLPVFDGRVEPLHEPGGGGFRQWFHFFNSHDLAFTARLPFADDCTSNLETDFLGLTNGSHDILSHNGKSYLSHPGGAPAWSAVTVEGADVVKALGAPAKSTSVADQAPAVVRTVTRKQRALLVGINEYPDPRNRLQGCINDVYLMSSVLQEFGFDPEAIRVVFDERATRHGIEERMEWLIDGVKPGDTRVFFYSGHGAQIPTYSEHAAPNGYEESLVPYDFDWTQAHAFTDSNFRKYYAQLPYDVDFFAGFDCCHAGGMRRGSLRPRGIDPPDDVRHRMLKWSAADQMWVPRNWVPKQPLRANRLFTAKSPHSSHTTIQSLGQAGAIRAAKDSKRTRADYGHKGPYMPLMMFACGEGELASEYEHGAISYGAFSFVFAKTLREQKARNKKATLKQLVDRSAAELYRLGYDQKPELVGPAGKYKHDTLLRSLLG